MITNYGQEGQIKLRHICKALKTQWLPMQTVQELPIAPLLRLLAGTPSACNLGKGSQVVFNKVYTKQQAIPVQLGQSALKVTEQTSKLEGHITRLTNGSLHIILPIFSNTSTPHFTLSVHPKNYFILKKNKNFNEPF